MYKNPDLIKRLRQAYDAVEDYNSEDVTIARHAKSISVRTITSTVTFNRRGLYIDGHAKDFFADGYLEAFIQAVNEGPPYNALVKYECDSDVEQALLTRKSNIYCDKDMKLYFDELNINDLYYFGPCKATIYCNKLKVDHNRKLPNIIFNVCELHTHHTNYGINIVPESIVTIVYTDGSIGAKYSNLKLVVQLYSQFGKQREIIRIISDNDDYVFVIVDYKNIVISANCELTLPDEDITLELLKSIVLPKQAKSARKVI